MFSVYVPEEQRYQHAIKEQQSQAFLLKRSF